MGKTLYTIVRILLGLSFIFFGVTKFLPLPSPTLPSAGMAFLLALGATGYMIPFVGICETLIGLMLVFNQWVPFSMALLTPIMVNVLLFNIILAPSLMSFVMMAILIVLQVYVIVHTWSHYKPLFARKTEA